MGMETYAIVPFPKVCDEGFCHGADGVVADKADDTGNFLQGFVCERAGEVSMETLRMKNEALIWLSTYSFGY